MAPRPRIIPMARPAFPAVLIPESTVEPADVEVDVAAEEEAVLDRVAMVVGDAARRGRVLATDVEPAKIMVGRLDELETTAAAAITDPLDLVWEVVDAIWAAGVVGAATGRRDVGEDDSTASDAVC